MSFSGLYVPLITPFSHDNHVDLASSEALAHSILEEGASNDTAATVEALAQIDTRADAALVVAPDYSRHPTTGW